MSTASTSRRFKFLQFTALFLGLVQVTGAVLWCLAGAGIYGSPLAGMSHRELAFIGSIILVGPVAALAAGLLAFRKPRWAGRTLLAGAALSAILGARYQEVGLLLAAIISLPMFLMGVLLLRARGAAAAEPTGLHSEDSVEVTTPPWQFSLRQLMLAMAAASAVLGLAWAHANAARHRDYVQSPFVERLMTSSQSARWPEPDANLLSRLQISGGGGAPLEGLAFNFFLDARLEPPPVPSDLPALLAGLRTEAESQLRNDGAIVLNATDLAGAPGQLAGVAGAFRIAYRWQRTQGTFAAWPSAVNTLQVKVEESRLSGILELH